MGALLGYARISTGDQEFDLQHDALTAAGCLRIFSDTASGALDERPELGRLLDHLRDGDTLVVWRLDRLGRSLRHPIDTVTMLAERGGSVAPACTATSLRPTVRRRPAALRPPERTRRGRA